MEKLTYHYNDKYIAIKGCTSLYEKEERKTAPTASAIARLAAYEDSGLTPEEVMELGKIVKCKDCKHKVKRNEKLYCHILNGNVPENYFCGSGDKVEES